MEDIFSEIVSNFSHRDFNLIFLIGLAIFGGTIGGRIFQKIKIPQVVGYIIIGILIGNSGLKLVSLELVNKLSPFNYFALGLIGFMIGGELKLDVIKKYGTQFLYILFSEALSAFIFVGGLTFLIVYLFVHNVVTSFVFAILLGAISSATAAAGTTDVLWEYKSKGPLTTILLGIVALDDILALFLFAIAASISSSLLGSAGSSFLGNMFFLLYELFGAVIFGALVGALFSVLLRKFNEEDKILTFVLGGIAVTLGVSIFLKIDMILSSMIMGIVITNMTPNKSKKIFNLLERISSPIYVLFFVLVGAKLNFQKMNIFIIFIIFIFLIGRLSGKAIGARLGAFLGKSASTVRKYLPLCLLSQSGVAIGLSIIASQKFPGTIGNNIMIVVTTTTFIVQIIGPIFIKFAITKANEAGLNVTEEDVLKMTSASELIKNDDNVFIYENMHLNEILNIFTENENLFFPVVNKAGGLTGIISVDRIKVIITRMNVNNLVVASDLMDRVLFSADIGDKLDELLVKMKQYNSDFIPVVDSKNGKFAGLIELRMLNKYVYKKLFEHKQAIENGVVANS